MKHKLPNIVTLGCAWANLAYRTPCPWSYFQSINGPLANRWHCHDSQYYSKLIYITALH